MSNLLDKLVAERANLKSLEDQVDAQKAKIKVAVKNLFEAQGKGPYTLDGDKKYVVRVGKNNELSLSYCMPPSSSIKKADK